MATRDSSFVLPAGFGRRLAELRRRSGMCQSDVARRISGRRSHSLISQLETGRLRNPTLGLLSSYLLAIRANWSEIVDLLDRCTAQPKAAESGAGQEIARSLAGLPRHTAMAASKYDHSVAWVRQAQGKPPEPVELRTLRARKLAAAHERRRRLLEVLRKGINREEFGAGLNTIQRHHLLTFGQKLWGILCRTRTRSTGRREPLLEEATRWIRSQNVLPEPAIEWTHRTVTSFFGELERKGELDRLPASTADRKKPDRRKYRQQQLQQHQRRLREYQQARATLIARIWSAVQQMLAKAGIGKEAHLQFLSLIRRVCYVIDWFEAPQRQQQEIENYLAEFTQQRTAQETELARRVAKTVAIRYRRLRTSLPPNPLAPSRY